MTFIDTLFSDSTAAFSAHHGSSGNLSPQRNTRPSLGSLDGASAQRSPPVVGRRISTTTSVTTVSGTTNPSITAEKD